MSNNTEFKWTVDLLAEFIRDYADKDGTAAELMEQFKESKQPKREWEIISLRNDGNLYPLLNGTTLYSYAAIPHAVHFDWALENGFEINSVKRLSDNEVFTIGDKVVHKNNEGLSDNIKRIILSNEGRIDFAPFFIMDHISFRCYIDKINHYKEPVFTTEDGIAIYKDYSGKISTVYEDFSFNYDCPMRQILSERDENYPFTIKYFSTKEAAREFILNNKPLFSLQEITTIGNIEDNNPYYKKLVALAESKLK